MKIHIKLPLVATIILLVNFVKAQPIIKSESDFFNASLYPKDSFSLAEKHFKLGKSDITIYLVQHEYEHEEGTICERWVEQRVNNKIIKSKYFYYNAGENNFNYDENQPIKKYFLFANLGEFTGKFYLVKEDGNWITLPGMWLWLTKDLKTFYTTTPEECGKCEVAKFDIKTETKQLKFSEKTEFYWTQIKRKDLLGPLVEYQDLLIH